MARFELEVEHDYSFDLIGIACHSPDYRLCWSLNKSLGLAFERADEPLQTLDKNKAPKGRFALFYCRNTETLCEYSLISNKSEGNIFLSEVKAADYLLMIKGMSPALLGSLMAVLQENKLVLAAFRIAVDQLKNKELLLF